jgi:hypothetical protein
MISIGRAGIFRCVERWKVGYHWLAMKWSDERNLMKGMGCNGGRWGKELYIK